MKSSPSVVRNDPITRNEARSVLGGSSPIKAPAGSSRQEAPPPPQSGNRNSEIPSNAVPEAPVVAETQIVAKETGARLIVGPDVKLKGAEILDCDTLVVEGRVEATMDSRVIRIADKGAFSGKVSIDVAEIHGSFDGELTARSQLIIHATGRVSGKIRYGKLVIAEGGELCGDINALAAERSSVPILNAISA
ncbi:cell shape determination protein CcmA [Azonexus hydrophilus]|uniref:Cell shape determination protein CcmA n=2 Tax=Azonexus hydrophilus TaxID=418702 RepID=A0A1R1I951_9RHOO|nr:polymer-forming cytoskeletal protein [Azonexus hydrophilus]OMG55296.1 cell shape determination protein CcmA [Azonexus hydrophilus]